MLYDLYIGDVPVGSLVAYDFLAYKFILCRKTECGGLKVIGHNSEPKPRHAFDAATLRVLEPEDEERVLDEVSYQASLHANGPLAKKVLGEDYNIAIRLTDVRKTIARITFLSSRVGLLDVCLVYHEITSAIASRKDR